MTTQDFESLLPLACTWAMEQERVILAEGVALAAGQIADARRVGVEQPERIRLLRVAQIPQPSHPARAAAVGATRLISPLTAGLTVRYGIFIRADSWQDRSLIVHECAHAMQYERLGGFEAFLRPYLMECVNPPGYPFGPLEQEAIRLQIEICS